MVLASSEEEGDGRVAVPLDGPGEGVIAGDVVGAGLRAAFEEAVCDVNIFPENGVV